MEFQPAGAQRPLGLRRFARSFPFYLDGRSIPAVVALAVYFDERRRLVREDLWMAVPIMYSYSFLGLCADGR